MALVAVSSTMEDSASAQLLFAYLRDEIGDEGLAIADGNRVIVERAPEVSYRISDAFCNFLRDR